MREKTYLLSLTSKLTSILSHLPSIDIFLVSTKVCLENSGQQCLEQECRLPKVQTTCCSYCVIHPRDKATKLELLIHAICCKYAVGFWKSLVAGPSLELLPLSFLSCLMHLWDYVLTSVSGWTTFIQVLYYSPPSDHSRMEPDILLFFTFIQKHFCFLLVLGKGRCMKCEF